MTPEAEVMAYDRAVVVGIDRYPGLRDLGGPENDARAFRDWLVSPAGGSVPEDHVRTILSSDFPAAEGSATATSARPTAQIVEEAFDRLLDVAEENGMWAGRRLYIYLAGHGFEPESEEPVLLAANATRIRTGSHIAGRLFADWFRRAALFDEVLLFMDCCREPASNAPLRQVPYSALVGSDAHRVRWMTGLATKWSGKSREKVLGDRTRGVFTATLLAGLAGAAAREDGTITDESLAGYLYGHMKDHLTPEELADPDIPKAPDVDYDRDPAHRIVLARVAPRKTASSAAAEEVARIALTVSCPDPTAEVVVLDGSFSAVARAIGTLRADLPPGLYQVTARWCSHLAEKIVKLPPGSAPVSVAFDKVAVDSAAPIAGSIYDQSHQSEAAARESRRTHATAGQGSQVMVFAGSYTKAGQAEAQLDVSGVELTNAAGTVSVSLAEAGVGGHASDAWHACNIALDPGVYQLRWLVGEQRFHRTIVASPGYQTQVFVRQMSDRTPIEALGSATIFCARLGAGFDPASPALQTLERARLALANGGPPLPDTVVDSLISGKREDPMLALVAAHLLLRDALRRGDRRPSAADPRLPALLAALRRMLGAGARPPHPDVEALALLLGEPDAAPSFEHPPMFAHGWAAVVKASWERPALMPWGSAAAQAASSLWSAGPWLVWREAKSSPPLPAEPPTLDPLFEALLRCDPGRLFSLPDLTSAGQAVIEALFPPRPPALAPPPMPPVQTPPLHPWFAPSPVLTAPLPETPLHPWFAPSPVLTAPLPTAPQPRLDPPRVLRSIAPPASPRELGLRLGLPPASLGEIMARLLAALSAP